MTQQVASSQVGARGAALIVTLGILAAFGPMSIDMYLPSLPTLQSDFAATTSQVQLTLSGFTIGFAVGQLIYGPLSDRLGRKGMLIAGIALYVVTSALCAVEQDIDRLIVLRFVQALGGGAGTVMTRAIVRDLYDKDAAARVLSLMVLVTMLAPLVAPFVGGYILKWTGWRAIFWLLTGFGVLCLVLTVLRLPETLPPDRRRKSGLGQMIGGFGIVLRHRQSVGYMICGALSFGGMLAMLSGTPFIFIQLFGVAPEHFAYFFAVSVVAVILGAYVNSRVVMRYGIRRLLAVGTGIAVVGGLGLAVVALLDIGGLAAIVIAIFVFMFPHNITNANATAAAMEHFPELAGTASALIGSIRFGTGAVIGALVGVLHDGTTHPMALIIAACALGSAAAFWLMTRDRVAASD